MIIELIIIAILLALNIVKSMIPSATAASVQDVNISTVYGLRTLDLLPENGSTLKVRVEPLFYSEGRHTCQENDSLQRRSSTC